MNYLRPIFSYRGNRDKSIELSGVGLAIFQNTKGHDFSSKGPLKVVKVLGDGTVVTFKSRADMYNNVYTYIDINTSHDAGDSRVVLRIACKIIVPDVILDTGGTIPAPTLSYVFGRPISDPNSKDKMIKIIPEPTKVNVGSCVEPYYGQQSWLSKNRSDMISFGYTSEYKDGDTEYTPHIKYNNNSLFKLPKTLEYSPILAACCYKGGKIIFYTRDNYDGSISLTAPILDSKGDIVVEDYFNLPYDGTMYTNLKKEVHTSLYSVLRFYSSVNKMLVRRPISFDGAIHLPEDKSIGFYSEITSNHSYATIEYPDSFIEQGNFIETKLKDHVIVTLFSDKDADPSYKYAERINYYEVYHEILSLTSIVNFHGINSTIEPSKFESRYSGESLITNEVIRHYVDVKEASTGAVDKDPTIYNFKLKSRISSKEVIQVLDESEDGHVLGNFNIYKEFEAIGTGNLFYMSIPLLDLPEELPPPPDFDNTLKLDSVVLYVNHDFTCKYKIERLSERIYIDGLLYTGLLKELQDLDQSYADAFNYPFSESPELSTKSKLSLHYRGEEYTLRDYPDNSVEIASYQYAYDGFYLVICGTIRGGVYKPKIGEQSMEYSRIYPGNPDEDLVKKYLEEPVTIIIDTSKSKLDYKILDYRVDESSTPLYFIPFILK